MEQKIKRGNKNQRKLRNWKDLQKIRSSDYDEFLERARGHRLTCQRKYDGELNINRYQKKRLINGTIGGRLRWDLPFIDEFEKTLKRARVKSATIMGEMVGHDKKGKPLLFRETMDIIRDPTPEEEKFIHMYIFELYELNNKRFDNTKLDVYLDGFKKLRKWFGKSRYIHPAKLLVGGVDEVKKMWKNWVKKQRGEGIVVRLDDGTIWKIKSKFPADVAVLGVFEGTGRLKNTAGGLVVGFMDEDRIFRYAGRVGTGYTDEQRAFWWDYAKKNKSSVSNIKEMKKGFQKILFTKPKLVVQIDFKEIKVQYAPAFKFSKGKYKFVGDLPTGIMREPRFSKRGIREDKKVTPADLRLTQIPDWKKELKALKKKASRVVFAFLRRTFERTSAWYFYWNKVNEEGKKLEEGMEIPGGQVDDKVKIEPGVYIGPKARVYGNVILEGSAKIFANSEISGNVRISDNAEIGRRGSNDRVEIRGKGAGVKISGDARIFEKAKIYDNAKIKGDALVYGNAEVSGAAKIFDDAQVYGNAKIMGAKIMNEARVKDNAVVQKVGRKDVVVSGDAVISGRVWITESTSESKHA